MKRGETGVTIRICAALLAALLAVGCSRVSMSFHEGGGRDYTVRGRVAQLPEPGNPVSGFAVSHQAIDDFVDRQGEVVGMDPMTMSFPLGPQVSLAGLALTDPIEFTLHVDWSAAPPVRITRLHKLPPGTPIVFRAAQPPGKKP
jgi:hypothetical protein